MGRTHAIAFWNAKTFNQDLSDWDVSKATDMEDMFEGSALSSDNYHKMLFFI
ncbi:MAG: BspA family leucine-rich repeat surface protein [Fibrobacter sp.]|nr:BspA family leucine-rich repeat surface protein [Fibrobacter sp.]